MWTNIVEPGKPQMICGVSAACWMTKVINTNSEYVALISTATMVTRTPLNVTFIRTSPLVKSFLFLEKENNL
jgi:uncharacterized membrane protein YadS